MNIKLRRIVPCLFALACFTSTAWAEDPKTTELEFCTAAGISEDKLVELVDSAAKSGLTSVPITIILRNDKNECLVSAKVKASWKGGSTSFSIGTSGRLVFVLSRDRTKELKLSVPEGYTQLKQTTVPGVESYQPPADFSFFDISLVNDTEVDAHIKLKLTEIHTSGDFTSMEVLQDQLSRTRCKLELPAPTEQQMSAAEIYQKCKSAVVVMSALSVSGQTRTGGGVIIAPHGIVATNYHVIKDDPKKAKIMGAMLSDGRVAAVREVLAADRAADVAIVRIDIDDLPAAPLSPGEPIGAPVTIIAHPNLRFFYLTHGYVCRYSRVLYAGEDRAYLEVSAEFMPGSSGAPAFAANGSVAGIVSTIDLTDKGMVFKQCAPVQSIRHLIESPDAQIAPQ